MKQSVYVVTIVLFALFENVLYSQTSSLNSDFELGNFTGWTASNGSWNRTTGVITFTNNTITTGRQTIISNLYYDRYTCNELPSIPPDGGKYVAKLGNNIKGGQVEQLRYLLTVNESNALFIYKYAVVFEDPGHKHDEQPFFDVAVRDNYGNIIDSLCGYNHIISGGNIPGFNTCLIYDHPTDNTRDTVVRWKPWTTVAMDLTPYIGQTVMLEFTNADCRLGGHWSYAYMEARTAAMKINVQACESDSIAILKAPEGFNSYVWSNGATTREIKVKLIEGNTYSCVMTSIPGCSVTLQAKIIIERLTVTPPVSTICKGQSAELTASGADYYEWDKNLGLGPVKTVFPLQTTTYSVTGITKNGCVARGTSTVTVLNPPQLTVQSNVPCEGETLRLQAESNEQVSFEWRGPNAFESTKQYPEIPYSTVAMNGSYSVVATSTNGCKNSSTIQVTIKPKPDITTSHTNACEGGEVSLRVFPSGLSYMWQGPGGFNSTNQFITRNPVTSNMTGVYTVIGKNIYNCTDTASFSLQVYPSPIANFTHTNPCVGTAMKFTNLSTGATVYDWDFGNGTYAYEAQPADVMYQSSVPYTVSLRVFNEFACSDTITKVVKPYAMPVAQFATDKACIGSLYTIKNLSYVENDVLSSWEWNLGPKGTSTQLHPQIMLTDATPIPVTLTVRTQYCSNSQTKNILSYPKPVLSPFQSNGCAPLYVQFPSIAEERVFYVWDFGDGETSQSPNPAHYFFNNTGLEKTFTVKQTVTTEFGCTDSTKHTINVYPQPISDFTVSKTAICSGESITLQNTSLFADSYIWNLGNGTNSHDAVVTVSYTNTSNKVLYVPITLKTQNVNSCVDSITKYIAVYPFPDKGIELSDTAGCSPFIPTLQTQSLAPYYEWNFGDGTIELSGNRVEHIFVNETGSPKTFPITLKVSTHQGCEALFTAKVRVYPSPDAQFVIDTNYGCSPFTAAFRNTSKGASSTYWALGNDKNFHVGENSFNHTFVNKNVYQESHKITLFAENEFGCTDKHALSVLVYPEVTALFTVQPTQGCSPFNGVFTNTSIGAETYQWIFGDNTFSSNTNTIHTYINTSQQVQTYNTQLIAISAYQCRDTSDVQTIQVYPKPIVQFQTSAVSGCSPLQINIQNATIGATQYMWDFGNSVQSPSLIPNQTYINTESTVKVTHIQLRASNEYTCTDTASQAITVYPQVIADFFPNVSGCSPLPIQFTNISKNGTSYSWNFGDGKFSTETNPVNTFINEGAKDTTYTITLIGSNHFSCADTIQKDIHVYPGIQAEFTVSSSVACSPMNTQITSKTKGAVYTEWVINNVSGQHIQEQSFMYTAQNKTTLPQVHVVELRVRNAYSCSNTQVQTLQIYPQVTADFTVSKQKGCSPLDVNFINTSSGAISYFWIFGDNSDASNANPGHTYLNYDTVAQNFPVQLVATSAYGCVDSSGITNLTVYPQPSAMFHVQSHAGCSPFTVTITDESVGATHYSWDFGSGNLSETFKSVHTFVNTTADVKTPKISLTVYNDYMCSDFTQEPLMVYPEVVADFIAPQSGCNPLSVTFQNTSLYAQSYLWNFGKGITSTAKDPMYSFTNSSLRDSLYTVSLRAMNVYGCRDSIEKQLTIYATPQASFLPSASQVFMPDAVVSFENKTKGEWQYAWHFGDGVNSTQANPEAHTYTSPGSKTVTLIAYSNVCSDTIQQIIKVLGPPVIARYDTSYAGCSPLEVTFTNKSMNATEYIWDFGDGTTSTEVHPTHTFVVPGTYIIQLTAKNEEAEDISRAHTVTVYRNPKADFSIAPEVVYLPDAEISTYNHSADVQDVTWYFGVDDISHDFQPTYKFTEEGEFNIALTVTSRDGCKDSLMIPKAIRVLHTCDLKFPNAFTPVLQESDGYYDSSVPETENNIFHPIFINIVEYELQIFNRWGEIVFESKELEKGWNGFYKKELSKSDVYVWKCTAQCLGGKTIQKVGNVTLLR
jgi:PKD repeat protein